MIKTLMDKETEINFSPGFRLLSFIVRVLHICLFTSEGRSCLLSKRAYRLIKEKKNYDEGYPFAARAVVLNSRNVLAYYLCGCYWIYKENFDEALAHIDKALEISGKPVKVFHCLPLVSKEELERYKELILCHITLLNNPQDVENYMRLADFYYLEKEYGKTLIVLLEVVKYDEQSPVIQEYLGRVYFRLDDYVKAIEHMELAVQNDPQDEILFQNLGVAYFKAGKFEKARDAFLDASHINGIKSEIFYLLGRTDMELKNMKAAVQDFKKALHLDPSHPQALEFLNKIQIQHKGNTPF